MNLRPGRLRAVAVLLVVLGLVAAACSNSSGEADSSPSTGGNSASAPGVSSTEIKFSVLGTKTNNPLGNCLHECFLEGIKAYFAYRNSEGGVNGRQLVVSKEVDDQLGQNQQKAVEIISANDTFATFSATQLATGWGEFAEAGVPLYGWAIHPAEMSGKDSIFGNSAPPCLDCMDRTFTYVAKLAGVKKIAALGYGVTDNSKQCVSQITDTVDRYKATTGQEIVYKNDSLAFGLANGVGPEVTAMKKAGAEIIMTCLDLNGMKTLAQELKRQGMDNIPMYHLNSYNQKFVTDADGLFEGDYMSVAFRPFEAGDGDSSMTAFRKWIEKEGGELDEMAMYGWIDADLAYQGLLAAGKNPTRDAVISATNKLTDYTAGGLIFPVDWSRQHVPATKADPITHGYKQVCRALVQVKNGKFQLVGGTKDKPFVCWPAKDDTWTEPTLTTFK
ncbi:ABC transporter substrate-binding protein [Parafrankia sp. EUN1f]|uniref:ABC transporter substrate-binding protein n=1 Tax=Parafrankia sp. EUN1f TaxID=102897 RepID=UPI0001C47832|nr:ABC transporter substrate-binding protein [Parafrankia sp. EUN1f]EFC79414.1 ABC-type branched-chain amino acid transport systems periplasmic component-like protein [Parafrankia sp. EUN1f]